MCVYVYVTSWTKMQKFSLCTLFWYILDSVIPISIKCIKIKNCK